MKTPLRIKSGAAFYMASFTGKISWISEGKA